MYGVVIIGDRSSKSTFGANKGYCLQTCKKQGLWGYNIYICADLLEPLPISSVSALILCLFTLIQRCLVLIWGNFPQVLVFLTFFSDNFSMAKSALMLIFELSAISDFLYLSPPGSWSWMHPWSRPSRSQRRDRSWWRSSRSRSTWCRRCSEGTGWSQESWREVKVDEFRSKSTER